MTRGTVRKPLSEGEILELGATVMQQLVRGIDPDKGRYYIRHKSELGRDMQKLGIHKMPEFDSVAWENFYQKHFGLTVELSNLHIPPKPDYPCRTIVVIPGVTNNRVFDACTKSFKTWRYESDLDTFRDVVKRPDGPYVIWVRDVIEADEDMKSKSANDIEAAGTNTLTLTERILLELKYFDETGKHLDIDNWTLCAGSRYSDGRVPRCGWVGGEFRVHWADVDYSYPGLSARVAVS
jgi:hypothetical protein